MRHRFVQGALLLALLVALGTGAYVWIRGRLSAIEAMEAELRRSVELELKAMADGDIELLCARLDPVDPRWQVRQLARYSLVSDATGFAPAPGLAVADRPLEIRQVQVKGRVGRVKLIRWYHPSKHSSTASLPLPFGVTWLYRRADEGVWYHTSPSDDFQRMIFNWVGTRLALSATEYEGCLLSPIARDLDNLMVQGCALIGCPPGTRYTVAFRDTLFPQVNGSRWVLPALYLTGIPEDEESQEGWRHALELWLVEALIQAQLERQDVSDHPLFRQIVVRLQTELSLQEPAAVDAAPFADSEAVRPLDGEVAVLLEALKTEVGSAYVSGLPPALGSDRRLDPFLLAHYRLDPYDMEGAWQAYLADLTGSDTSFEAALSVYAFPVERPEDYPPAPIAPAVTPGDQIAMVCDGQIWVGNLDGSNFAPLTDTGERFESVYWSPDGRWLLTSWQDAETYQPRAPYLLAADGSQGRLLPSDPGPSAAAVGWSPDGYAVYSRRVPLAASLDAAVEFWMWDVDDNVSHQLPRAPVWSPDGRHLVHLEPSPTDSFAAVFLTETADLAGSTRDAPGVLLDLRTKSALISDRVERSSRAAWSPDGAKLALVLGHQDPNQSAIAVFDLATGHLTPLVTLSELKTGVRPEKGLFFSDTHGLDELRDEPFVRLAVNGWAADGQRLLVTATGDSNWRMSKAPTALILVRVDGGPSRLLAYAQSGAAYGVVWSPINPDRFVLAWRSGSEPSRSAWGFLVDLELGLLYAAAESWNATWSPDGAWVAFAGQNQVIIVDQEGRPRSILRPDHFCSLPAWNPATKITLPEGTCKRGLDLWIDANDVRQIGNYLLIRVGNRGDQPVKNVPVRVVDGSGKRSEPMGLGSLPACGNLLVRMAGRDWADPLAIILNPQDDPGALNESDYGNNRATVTWR